MTLLGCLTTATLWSFYLRKFWHYLKDCRGKSFVVTWEEKKQVYLVLCQVLCELLENFLSLHTFSLSLPPFLLSVSVCVHASVRGYLCASVEVRGQSDFFTWALEIWTQVVRLMLKAFNKPSIVTNFDILIILSGLRVRENKFPKICSIWQLGYVIKLSSVICILQSLRELTAVRILFSEKGNMSVYKYFGSVR